jgi:hypothetical protein
VSAEHETLWLRQQAFSATSLRKETSRAIRRELDAIRRERDVLAHPPRRRFVAPRRGHGIASQSWPADSTDVRRENDGISTSADAWNNFRFSKKRDEWGQSRQVTRATYGVHLMSVSGLGYPRRAERR